MEFPLNVVSIDVLNLARSSQAAKGAESKKRATSGGESSGTEEDLVG